MQALNTGFLFRVSPFSFLTAEICQLVRTEEVHLFIATVILFVAYKLLNLGFIINFGNHIIITWFAEFMTMQYLHFGINHPLF